MGACHMRVSRRWTLHSSIAVWRGHAGVALRDPFPGNRWYRNAITAAIDFPDLPGCPGGEGIFDGSITNMGNNQVIIGSHWFVKPRSNAAVTRTSSTALKWLHIELLMPWFNLWTMTFY